MTGILVSRAREILGESQHGEQSMTMATGSFTMKTWDEQSYGQVEGGPRIAHAHSTNTYTGAITGESSVNYVTLYLDGDATCLYRGYEQIEGTLDGRTGSFVLEHVGSWQDNKATTTWTVIEGSGTGELAGLTGTGGYVAEHDVHETAVTLEYHLPALE